jgi:bzd-type benzoyl-CoA reductase Q subunit
MEKEYWRWDESSWVSDDVDWKKGDLIVGGCDVGSISTQMVIMVDGKLYAYSNVRSKGKSSVSSQNSLEKALEATDMRLENIEYIVGTGYGRVQVPFANRDVTEISCHARGANYLYGPSVRTILDMGGQDLKVISVDEKGKVQTFIMNDKCAAGAGRGMETMAELLSVSVEEVGDFALTFEGDLPPISPECVVFAKNDALRRMKEGWPKNSILAAYCGATAWRVYDLLVKVGIKREFAITGGIAKNKAVVKKLEERLGFEALKPDFDTQIAGAVGAAFYAKALAERARSQGNPD